MRSLNLTPEIEASLLAQAQAAGLPLDEFLSRQVEVLMRPGPQSCARRSARTDLYGRGVAGNRHPYRDPSGRVGLGSGVSSPASGIYLKLGSFSKNRVPAGPGQEGQATEMDFLAEG